MKCEDMEKNISCKLCHFQTLSVEVICGHLLHEHLDLVAPLQEFLSKTKVGHVSIEQTLYDFMFGSGGRSPTCASGNKEDVESSCTGHNIDDDAVSPEGSKTSISGDNSRTVRSVTTMQVLENDGNVSENEHMSHPGDGDENVNRTGSILQTDSGVEIGLKRDGALDSSGEHSEGGSTPHVSGDKRGTTINKGLKHDVREEGKECVRTILCDSTADMLGNESSSERVKNEESQHIEESRSEIRGENRDYSRNAGRALATDIGREKAIMFTGGLNLVIRRYAKFTFRCPKCGWHRKTACDSFNFIHHCEDTAKNKLCEHCGKTYSNKVIKNHLQTCQGSHPKKAKCTVCGKEYTTKSTLHSHMRKVHRSKKLHTCSICEKQLASKKALELHEAKHRKDYLFTCPFCQKGFHQKSNMTTHIRQHTGEQPFLCDHCLKAFTNKVCLKAHLKKYHGIDLWKEAQTRGLGRPKKRKTTSDDEDKLCCTERKNDTSSLGGSKTPAKGRVKRGQKRKQWAEDVSGETRGRHTRKRSGVGKRCRKHGNSQGGEHAAIPGEGNENGVGRQLEEKTNMLRKSGRRAEPFKRD